MLTHACKRVCSVSGHNAAAIKWVYIHAYYYIDVAQQQDELNM